MRMNIPKLEKPATGYVQNKEKEMQRRVKVLSPRSESSEVTRKVAERKDLKNPRGRTIAFVDDGRPNGDFILAKIRERLEKEHDIKSIVVEKQSLGIGSNMPLPKDLFEQLTQNVHAVIMAVAS